MLHQPANGLVLHHPSVTNFEVMNSTNYAHISHSEPPLRHWPQVRSTASDDPISSTHYMVTPLLANPLYSQFAQKLDVYVRNSATKGVRASRLEFERFTLCRYACAKEDSFFLSLHQLFCLWSRQAVNVYKFLMCPPGTIDAGFRILTSILGGNKYITPRYLQFFSLYPNVLSGSTHPRDETSMVGVATFLAHLCAYWDSLSKAVYSRGYPFLMTELTNVLNCLSPILQTLLFRNSVAWLYLPEGIDPEHFESLFINDQNAHTSDRISRSRARTDHERNITISNAEQRDRELINAYHQITAKWLK